MRRLSERIRRSVGVVKEVVMDKPLMRPVIAAVSVIPVGVFFFELALHHRQLQGIAMALVLFSLSNIVVWTWLQGSLRKAMLAMISLTFAFSLSFVDYSRLSNVDQQEDEEAVRQVIDESFRENRDYLDKRFERIEDMFKQLRTESSALLP